MRPGQASAAAAVGMAKVLWKAGRQARVRASAPGRPPRSRVQTIYRHPILVANTWLQPHHQHRHTHRTNLLRCKVQNGGRLHTSTPATCEPTIPASLACQRLLCAKHLLLLQSSSRRMPPHWAHTHTQHTGRMAVRRAALQTAPPASACQRGPRSWRGGTAPAGAQLLLLLLGGLGGRAGQRPRPCAAPLSCCLHLVEGPLVLPPHLLLLLGREVVLDVELLADFLRAWRGAAGRWGDVSGPPECQGFPGRPLRS